MSAKGLTVLTPHPSLSPEERVSVSGSPEGSVIAGFVAAANRSSGTLMLDAFAKPTAAIVQTTDAHTILQNGAELASLSSGERAG